jgi:uncharacterized protein YhaN
MYTIGTAAKATGKAKSTISKAISSGAISATKNANGSYSIDPAELHRVFPVEASANGPEKRDLDDLEPFDLRFETRHLKAEIQQLRERMADLDTLHERERQQLTERVEDLRQRLDQSEQERREKDRQLTALLTDQRPPVEPSPATAGRGFWTRFTRRSGSA